MFATTCIRHRCQLNWASLEASAGTSTCHDILQEHALLAVGTSQGRVLLFRYAQSRDEDIDAFTLSCFAMMLSSPFDRVDAVSSLRLLGAAGSASARLVVGYESGCVTVLELITLKAETNSEHSISARSIVTQLASFGTSHEKSSTHSITFWGEADEILWRRQADTSHPYVLSAKRVAIIDNVHSSAVQSIVPLNGDRECLMVDSAGIVSRLNALRNDSDLSQRCETISIGPDPLTRVATISRASASFAVICSRQFFLHKVVSQREEVFAFDLQAIFDACPPNSPDWMETDSRAALETRIPCSVRVDSPAFKSAIRMCVVEDGSGRSLFVVDSTSTTLPLNSVTPPYCRLVWDIV